MSAIFLLAATIFLQTSPDPNRLPIGTPGEVTVQTGQLLNARTARIASVSEVVKASENVRFLLLGESHTSPQHHKMQADIIDAVASTGRPVVVGFEMFTRPIQDELNPWTMGWWTEDEFIQKADWKKQWGFDYALYRPVFETIRSHKIPMIALNVPRSWPHDVAMKGPKGLTEEQQKQIPPLDLTNSSHRKIFDALTGGHPMGPVTPDNMYAAQVLWDTSMADSAVKYLDSHSMPSNTLVIILAGAGHVAYGQGINYRLSQRNAGPSLSVVMVDAEDKATVSRGLGDFVYASHP